MGWTILCKLIQAFCAFDGAGLFGGFNTAVSQGESTIESEMEEGADKGNGNTNVLLCYSWGYSF